MAALDYSNDPLKPTLLELSPSTSGYEITVINSVGDTDKADYIYFDIPSNHELADIILTAYKSSDNKAFVALQKGKAITANEQNPSTLMGYTHFGPLKPEEAKGKSILDLLGGKKPADSYSLWIQQLGTLTDYSFKIKLNTVTVPVTDTPSIAPKKYDFLNTSINTLSISDLSVLKWSEFDASVISATELSKLEWKYVKASSFSDKTYSQLKWSSVKVGNFSAESKKTLDWQKVKIGGTDGASTESLSTTDLFQYNAANGKAVVDYKKTNLNQFKFGEFSETSYEAINWSKVNFKGITAETYSQMDFSEVITSKGFSAATYKSVDWSKVDYGYFKAETYQKTDWSKVSFGKLSSSSYSAMDWSQVVTSTGFKAATYKAVNWGLVDFGDYKAETYQKTDWSKVNFKQFSASSYSSLDWSKVVTASGFNAAAYKSVNWGQVDFGDFKQQTFATTNWNQVNFKQLSASQYQAINWNEINLGALSTKTYKAIDWKKVNVAAFDAESVATAKWSLMKGVTKPTAAAKPAEADLSFLGVTAASGSTGGLIGAAEQSSSSQYPVLVNSAETPKPFIM